jgi:DNA sulfur modification protein DndD
MSASNGRPVDVASVGLEFDYAEGGVVHRYRVVRRWTVRGAKTVETLTLDKDDAPVESVPRDEWHNFLQEFIPPGVSQLFFFDGEKIADIARDDPDEGLADAVRGLLGIELVGRLRTDLATRTATASLPKAPGGRFRNLNLFPLMVSNEYPPRVSSKIHPATSIICSRVMAWRNS